MLVPRHGDTVCIIIQRPFKFQPAITQRRRHPMDLRIRHLLDEPIPEHVVCEVSTSELVCCKPVLVHKFDYRLPCIDGALEEQQQLWKDERTDDEDVQVDVVLP